MRALVFLMSWETPTKCAHDGGQDRGSGRGGGAGKEGEAGGLGGLGEEGDAEGDREQVMGGGGAG